MFRFPILEAISQFLRRLLPLYFLISIALLRYTLSPLLHIKRFPFFVPLADSLISIYFRYCGLSPCTVDLDDRTTMHYWTATHRRFDKPGLVLIHGYGSTAPWQIIRQVGPLARTFNLYIPDLLFFGKSYTNRPDRSDEFQAKCVGRGLRRLGVERCSVYAISYGGWVGYRMAEIFPEMVERVVIVSCGVGATEEQRGEQVRKIGKENVVGMLCPERPEHLRMLTKQAIHKIGVSSWVPDFFLSEFIQVMCKDHRKERLELVEYLLTKKADSELPVLTQETLLIWGDRDNVFPLCMAHQLQRHLGPKSKLEIIEDTGHAANIESPDLVNALIKWFVLGSPKLCS